MKKSYFVLIVLFMAGGLIGLYMYLTNTRFILHTTKDGAAYKIDKRTGQTWFVRGGREKLVKEIQETEQKTSTTTSSVRPIQSLSDEELMEMAYGSVIQAVKGSFDVLCVSQYTGTCIEDKLKSSKETIKSITGWNARQIGKGKYYVTYSYLTEKGSTGWAFEVLDADNKHIVRLISGNPALEKEYANFLEKHTGKWVVEDVIDVTDEALGLKKGKK